MKKGLGKGLGAIMGINTFDAPNENNKHIGKEYDSIRPNSSISSSSKNALITSSVKKSTSSNQNLDENVSRETFSIKISLIEPRQEQPRKKIDKATLGELADSIKTHGLLQPILVRKKGGMYEIIAGERRWRAARMAGLKEIPVIVRNLDDKSTKEAALIENIQREDLNGVEEARAYKALINEYGLTQEELAKRLSKSRTAITNSLRLLNLDEEIIKMLEAGQIQAGHARAILSIEGKENQLKAANETAKKALSVRDTEKLAKRYNIEAEKIRKALKDKSEDSKEKDIKITDKQSKIDLDIYLKDLANRLTEAVNAKVSIKPTGLNKGHIDIEYYSREELNDLAERLL